MKRILPIIPFLVFILIGQISNAQWTSVYTDEISADRSQIFVVNDILFLKAQDNRTFRSADQGTSWQEISSTFTPGFGNVREVVTTFVGIGNEIFTSTQPETTTHILYVSNDGGVTFSPRYTFNNATIVSLVNDGNTLYAVSVGRDIYKSTDNGNTFEKIVLNYLPNNTLGIKSAQFQAVGSTWIIVTTSAGTIRSNDGGNTWVPKEPAGTNKISWIFKAKNTIWGASNDGLLKYNPSTDSWSVALSEPFFVMSSISSNGNLLLCSFASPFIGENKHYVSTDDGASWTELTKEGMLPQNMGYLSLKSNEISSTHYFVIYFSNISGRVKTIVYRRPLTTTSIKDQLANNGLTLKPNFPNPFHNQTTISWTIQSSAQVTIRIYDINGKEMETLVSGKYNPGDYTTQLNTAGRYMPGIYFCRMQAGKHTVTSKMVVQ
jgi:hypothetical protein